MPCLLGELCSPGQREQGPAQMEACQQLQNRSNINGTDGGGNGGDFGDLMNNMGGWVKNNTNNTMVSVWPWEGGRMGGGQHQHLKQW